jgi:MFS family permease
MTLNPSSDVISNDAVGHSTQQPDKADPRPVEKDCSIESEIPFSIFNTHEKKWISFLASFGAMFSTLSSYIYFPALVPMATDLGVSVALINLTVTSYLIVAGVAPAFMGDISDQGGRRPAYILMFALVVGSNIGLALQNSYPVLFVLRMIQSAGASGRLVTIPPLWQRANWFKALTVRHMRFLRTLQLSQSVGPTLDP